MRATFGHVIPVQVKKPHARRNVRPKPSLEPPGFCRQRKPGPRARRHCRSQALRCLPPRSAQHERWASSFLFTHQGVVDMEINAVVVFLIGIFSSISASAEN